jgi:hypothetical protein
MHIHPSARGAVGVLHFPSTRLTKESDSVLLFRSRSCLIYYITLQLTQVVCCCDMIEQLAGNVAENYTSMRAADMARATREREGEKRENINVHAVFSFGLSFERIKRPA